MEAYLPDWIKEGTRTRELLGWLKNGGACMESFYGYRFAKSSRKGCVLIYMPEAHKRGGADRIHHMQLCGIFREKDYALFEVSEALYQAAGIPEEFCFPDKAAVQADMEEKVTARAWERMEKEWDQLLVRSGFTVGELIPAMDRDQIRMAAGRYRRMGKTSGEIIYLPRFSYERTPDGFPDDVFLQYLADEKKVIETVTERWLLTNLSTISKKRIYYGCVKEEMAEMEKNSHAAETKEKIFLNIQDAERKSA